MVSSEIAAEVQSLLDREISEVLVPEGDDFALSDEQRQLVSAGRAETAQLHAADLGAYAGGQVAAGGGAGKEIGEGGISGQAVLGVGEGLQWCVFLVRIPGRKVVWVL